MWLARATATRLIGVDFSAVAVETARSRSGARLPADRVDLRVGTLEDTGLPGACADAAVSLDALPLAPDPEAAAAEAARLLRPGGRLAFTAAAPAEGACPWTGLLRAAGLHPGPGVELPGLSDGWRRLYAAFREHADALRADLGATAADTLLAEADTVGPMLDSVRWRLVEAGAPR
ncbi:class I SAM-dependent methyltransferase [Nocardiopsis coralliicola]